VLLHLFQQLDPIQNLPFARLLNLPRQHEFVQNGIHLVEIKDNVQFTHIGKEGIQQFHKQMYRLQVRKLIVGQIHGNRKKQTRVPPVNEFVGIVLNEIGVLFIPGRDEAVHFGFDAGLFGFARRGGSTNVGCRRGNVPFGQAGFALAVLQ
jgi:hypothetical protein